MVWSMGMFLTFFYVCLTLLVSDTFYKKNVCLLTFKFNSQSKPRESPLYLCISLLHFYLTERLLSRYVWVTQVTQEKTPAVMYAACLKDPLAKRLEVPQVSLWSLLLLVFRHFNSTTHYYSLLSHECQAWL